MENEVVSLSFIFLIKKVNMYISSVSVTFSLKDSISLYSTSLTLDHTVGCTLLHALHFVYNSPIVKSYLRKNYYITNLNFKYSEL